VSASFTSTHLGIRTTNRAASLADKVVRYAAIQDNGYVRIKTSLGELNVELFCKWVPLTCENFLKHCRAGYYNKTLFHRSIKHFMVQVRTDVWHALSVILAYCWWSGQLIFFVILVREAIPLGLEREGSRLLKAERPLRMR
jgi:hypothetical protein